MSEFQTYHFRAIDQPLNNKEQGEVNQLSSRFSTSATFYSLNYAYSDFRHDEEKVLEKYFDAFLYEANWGSRKLMFRFPKTVIDVKALQKFIADDMDYSSIVFRIKGKFALLKFEFGVEEGWEEWIDENPNWLDRMLELREDIINEDYRCLYLFWLKINEQIRVFKEYEEDEFDEDEKPKAPPVPHNLKKLTSALKSFADFFHIENEIIKLAAKESKSASKNNNYENLIEQLSNKEKNEWLVRLTKSETRLDLLFRKRLDKIDK